MNILAEILNVHKYLTTFTCIFIDACAHAYTHIDKCIGIFGLSSNFSENQLYLSHLNANNRNEQKKIYKYLNT